MLLVCYASFYFIIIFSNYIENLKIANEKKYLARYMGDAPPQARCWRGRMLKLSDTSQSKIASGCPSRPGVERDDVNRVNLLLIFVHHPA